MTSCLSKVFQHFIPQCLPEPSIHDIVFSVVPIDTHIYTVQSISTENSTYWKHISTSTYWKHNFENESMDKIKLSYKWNLYSIGKLGNKKWANNYPYTTILRSERGLNNNKSGEWNDKWTYDGSPGLREGLSPVKIWRWAFQEEGREIANVSRWERSDNFQNYQ